MKYNKIIGSLGENMAADILEQQGYEVIARNYTCKLGEIDIIAMDIKNVAGYFLRKHADFSNYNARFDVVEIECKVSKNCF